MRSALGLTFLLRCWINQKGMKFCGDLGPSRQLGNCLLVSKYAYPAPGAGHIAPDVDLHLGWRCHVTDNPCLQEE